MLMVIPVFLAVAFVSVGIPLLLGLSKEALLGQKITDPVAFIMQVIHYMVFVGVVEEIVFRGFLLRGLKEVTKSDTLAVIISALIFGIWHFPANQDFLQVAMTAVIGLLYGFSLVKIKNCSLLTVGIAHGLQDTFLLILTSSLL